MIELINPRNLTESHRNNPGNYLRGSKVMKITLEEKNFYKKVIVLVIPMALQNLINVGITTADVVMLGKVGETVLSGASLAGQIQFILTLIIFGLASGASVLTAQYWGKGDIKTIEKVLGISLFTASIGALFFTCAAISIPTQLMRFFTKEPDVIFEGVKYLKIVGLSYLFAAISMIYLHLMRSVERVLVATVIYFISFILNIILNSVLIFGLFGFPEFGIEGAAIATLCARIFEFVCVIVYALKINKVIKIRIKYIFNFENWIRKDFFKYSFPVVLNEIMWGLGTSVIAAIIGHLGSSAVAANSVAQVSRQLATVISFGLASAAAIMIGKIMGEHKYELAKQYARRFMLLSFLAGTLGGSIVFFARPLIISFMGLTHETSSYLTFMLFVMSYFIIGQALNATAIVGVFRAGGDTRFGVLLDTSSMWGCSILLGAVAAFVFKCSVPIVYIILMSDEIIKLPLMLLHYKKQKWVKNITRE